jgi:hypothetical protein
VVSGEVSSQAVVEEVALDARLVIRRCLRKIDEHGRSQLVVLGGAPAHAIAIIKLTVDEHHRIGDPEFVPRVSRIGLAESPGDRYLSLIDRPVCLAQESPMFHQSRSTFGGGRQLRVLAHATRRRKGLVYVSQLARKVRRVTHSTSSKNA